MSGRLVLTSLSILALAVMGVPAASAQSQGISELGKRRITLNLKEVDARTAVLLLFSGTGVPHVVDESVPNIVVSGELKDRPFHEALQWLMAKILAGGARLQYGFGRDAFFLVPNPNTAEEAKKNTGAQRKVQLKLKGLPLQRALDVIFMASGLQYSVHPKVPDVPVTVELKAVTIEQALSMLVEATSMQVRLGVTLERDVYVIRVAG